MELTHCGLRFLKSFSLSPPRFDVSSHNEVALIGIHTHVVSDDDLMMMVRGFVGYQLVVCIDADDTVVASRDEFKQDVTHLWETRSDDPHHIVRPAKHSSTFNRGHRERHGDEADQMVLGNRGVGTGRIRNVINIEEKGLDWLGTN